MPSKGTLKKVHEYDIHKCIMESTEMLNKNYKKLQIRVMRERIQMF